MPLPTPVPGRLPRRRASWLTVSALALLTSAAPSTLRQSSGNCVDFLFDTTAKNVDEACFRGAIDKAASDLSVDPCTVSWEVDDGLGMHGPAKTSGGTTTFYLLTLKFWVGYKGDGLGDIAGACVPGGLSEAVIRTMAIHELLHHCINGTPIGDENGNCEELAVTKAALEKTCAIIKALNTLIANIDAMIVQLQNDIEDLQQEMPPGWEDAVLAKQQNITDLTGNREALNSEKSSLCEAYELDRARFNNDSNKKTLKKCHEDNSSFIDGHADCPSVKLPPLPPTGEDIFGPCGCCNGSEC